MNKKIVLLISIVAVLCFGLVFARISTNTGGTNETEETNAKKEAAKAKEEQLASEQDDIADELKQILDHIQATEVAARKGTVNFEANEKEELPDISKYDLTVTGQGQIDIEIFGSIEKTGEGTDGWLNEVAEKFNEMNFELNGQKVSVSVRAIASGMGMDYIVSEKHLPDVYIPANELWGEMVKESGIEIELAASRLAGNVAGILLSQDKYDQLVEKYGSINMKTITQATAANEIGMGYTNPFVSATGLNFLVSTLNAFDSSDILSATAVVGFEEFQANVPFVAYATMQMRDAAESGIFDGMVMEYQTYVNTRELRDYTFTPFGVRHDSPVYAVGGLAGEKREALNLFLEYCAGSEAQDLAKEYGFNEMDDYRSEMELPSGDVLLDAQALWKEKKDSGKPVTAVFVADVSGSMDGEPLNSLKKSLVNASSYINDENKIGLVSYNSNVYINLPIGKFDLNQRAYFTGAVEDLYAAGGTASFNAICVALDMLLDAKAANPDTKLIMFLLSDGETNEGYNLEEIRGILEFYKIPVYTIGYNADIAALETISKINEGTNINADSDDVVYKLKSLFNSQM